MCTIGLKGICRLTHYEDSRMLPSGVGRRCPSYVVYNDDTAAAQPSGPGAILHFV